MTTNKNSKRRRVIRGGKRTRTGRKISARVGGRFELSRPFHSLKKSAYRKQGKRFSGKSKYDYNHKLKEAWLKSRKADPQLRRTYLHKFAPEQEVPWLNRLLGVPTYDDLDASVVVGSSARSEWAPCQISSHLFRSSTILIHSWGLCFQGRCCSRCFRGKNVLRVDVISGIRRLKDSDALMLDVWQLLRYFLLVYQEFGYLVTGCTRARWHILISRSAGESLEYEPACPLERLWFWLSDVRTNLFGRRHEAGRPTCEGAARAGVVSQRSRRVRGGAGGGVVSQLWENPVWPPPSVPYFTVLTGYHHIKNVLGRITGLFLEIFCGLGRVITACTSVQCRPWVPSRRSYTGFWATSSYHPPSLIFQPRTTGLTVNDLSTYVPRSMNKNMQTIIEMIVNAKFCICNADRTAVLTGMQ